MPSSHVPVKVFIADDSVLIRNRIATLLETSAMNIVGQAGTPQDCIAGILVSAPDVVVLDVQLEGGSGLEVLGAVRLVAPQVAFVVFSSNSGPAYRKRYAAEGAEAFLDKSTEFDQLADIVTKTWRRRAALISSH